MFWRGAGGARQRDQAHAAQRPGGGRAVGGDLGRDRARVQRPGEEAPRGRQVTIRR